MQFFWKHLHSNKGDENVSKLIWIVIAFVIGALLLSTLSIAFKTDGTVGGWLNDSIESWFGEPENRDGSTGGSGAGGSGPSGGGGGTPEDNVTEATIINNEHLSYNDGTYVADSTSSSYSSFFENLGEDDIFKTSLSLPAGGENLIYDFSTTIKRNKISNASALNEITSENIIVLQCKDGTLAYAGLNQDNNLTVVSGDNTTIGEDNIVFSAIKCSENNVDIPIIKQASESTISYYEELNNSLFEYMPVAASNGFDATLVYSDGSEENIHFKKCYYQEGIEMWTYLPDSVKNDFWYNPEVDKGLIFAVDAKLDANGNIVPSVGNCIFYISYDDATLYDANVDEIVSIKTLGAEINNFGLFTYYLSFVDKNISVPSSEIPVKLNLNDGTFLETSFIFAGEEEGMKMWVADVGFGIDYPLILGYGLDINNNPVEGGFVIVDGTDGDGYDSLYPATESIEILGKTIPFTIGKNHVTVNKNILTEGIPQNTDIKIKLNFCDNTSDEYNFIYVGKVNDTDRWRHYVSNHEYLEFAYNAKTEDAEYGRKNIVPNNGTSVFALLGSDMSQSTVNMFQNIVSIEFLGTTKTFCMEYYDYESFGDDVDCGAEIPFTTEKIKVTFTDGHQEILIKQAERVYADLNNTIELYLRPSHYDLGFVNNYPFGVGSISVEINGKEYDYKTYDFKNDITIHIGRIGQYSFTKFNESYSEALIEVIGQDEWEDYPKGYNNGNEYPHSPATNKYKIVNRAIISNSTTKISAYAFRGCEQLYTIYIPESVTYIASTAFEGCTSLTTIYGVAGSYAETFANANGYNFITI